MKEFLHQNKLKMITLSQ